MRRYVLEFGVSALSFWFIAWVLPGLSIRDWGTAFIAAGLVSILNAILWPIVARGGDRWDTSSLVELLQHP